MKKVIIAIVLLFSLSTVFVSCREQKTTEEKVEEAVEETGDAIEDTADEIEEEVEDLTDDND